MGDVEGAREGRRRTICSGDRYKPSAIRAYDRAMRLRVLPVVWECAALGPASTGPAGVRVPPARRGSWPRRSRSPYSRSGAICRRALSQGELVVNPCNGFPPCHARPARALCHAVGSRCADRAGARRRPLDLGDGNVRGPAPRRAASPAGARPRPRGRRDPSRVRLGVPDGQIALKSHAGRRKVPISAVLRDFLVERLAESGRSDADRVFGLTSGASPFDPSKLTKRADRLGRRRGSSGSPCTSVATPSPR